MSELLFNKGGEFSSEMWSSMTKKLYSSKLHTLKHIHAHIQIACFKSFIVFDPEVIAELDFYIF